MSWDLDGIVLDLRASRDRAGRNGRDQRRVDELPSRAEVERIVDGIHSALFPRHSGARDLSEQGLDYFVGHTLDAALRALVEQARREIRFSSGHNIESSAAIEEQAIAIGRGFAAALSSIRETIETDIQAAYEGDPAAKSTEEVLLSYPGIRAVILHRLGHALYALDAPVLARIVAEIAHSATGIDIHPGAAIGRSFFIDHGTGVVIGETAVIGDRVRLYQAVTLGAKRFTAGENGALVKGEPRHPIIEDDVVIYAGATILGRVVIGRGSVIGGNVWLTHGVPPGSQITQAQARTEVFGDGAGI